MSTRTTLLLVTILAFGGAACAEDGGETGQMEAGDTASETPELPETTSWEVRLDDPSGDEGSFQFVEEGGEFRIQTGPRAITYQNEQLVQGGDFRVHGTFLEEEAPADHREAYGIFFGGRNLQEAGVRYHYFLVRGDGQYLIKSRDGESTETVADWTSSDAARPTDEGGSSRNELAVEVEGDSIRFLVNGEPVETRSTEEMNPYGVVGLRINHRLQLRVRDWGLEGAMVEGSGSGGEMEGGSAADTAGS